ncbi:MAG: ABC transporter ATP-binding protein [Ruminococcus sp.]|nr:ABC transporter ATP-binding protein [Ruminococcus sp.]
MKSNALKWISSSIRGKRYYIVLLTVLQAIHGGSGVIYALLMRNIVDSAVKKDNADFTLNVWLTIALIAGQIGLRAILRWLTELAKADYENAFKRRLLQNIMKKDFASVNSVHSGEWLNRLTNDTTVIANGCVEIIPGMSGMIVKMISALVMMIILEAKFAFILIPGGALMIIFTFLFRKKIKALHKKVQEKDGNLRIFLQEHIGSLMMIRSFVAEEQTFSDADNKMESHKSARMVKNRLSNVCNIGFGAAMQGMYLFGVCYCGYGILKNRITFGTLTAITQLISQIQAPMANITGYLPKFYAMTASAERIMEIEAYSDDMTDSPVSMNEVAEFYSNKLDSVGLDSVSFTYLPPASENNAAEIRMPVVIENISMQIHKGEYVALTGRSGCGKSTILKLLMTVYKPDSGNCFINDKNGGHQPLTPEWHRLFAYVPQGNQLMSGTVREVISFADKSASTNSERLDKALKIACAYDFVNELEAGVDTLLGERGAGLSEGQLQRIAVARAIFSESPILILDEATSALDETTEKQLLENLRKMTDKTVVIVTHRPAALSICDKVLEITGDSVIEK